MATKEEWMDEGDSALAIGELEAAAKCFRLAVEQDPNFQDGWHALGMALYKLERYEEAIEAGKRRRRSIQTTSLSGPAFPSPIMAISRRRKRKRPGPRRESSRGAAKSNRKRSTFNGLGLFILITPKCD
jgi:tetratricopeptide (TPR) repeat protein